MKSFKAFVIVAVVAVAMVGCKKLEKVLPKKSGTWKETSETTVSYEDGVQVSTTTETDPDSLGTWKFNDDGTGIVTYPGGSDAIEWSVNSDNDQITVTEQGSAFAIAIDVLENGSKEQTWSYDFTIEVGGTEFRDEYMLELQRED